MNITSARYKADQISGSGNISIMAEIDGVYVGVPIDPANRHYQAILEWAEEDGNEIQAAE